MQYAICNLGIIPLRSAPADTSEMVSQVLYGEHFKVLEARTTWSRIRTGFDGFEAWIHNKQFQVIPEESYRLLDQENLIMTADLVDYLHGEKDDLIPVPLGGVLNAEKFLGHRHNGNSITGKKDKHLLLDTAFLYLNAPFLSGGRSPFGIDAAGFTQMVYKLNGYKIKRLAEDQAKEGESLSFIEESEAGDLAFFDDKEGNITHAGIMMNDNYIIHADGKVRLDRIDHSGIYNAELNKHTHQLRVIKKII